MQAGVGALAWMKKNNALNILIKCLGRYSRPSLESLTINIVFIVLHILLTMLQVTLTMLFIQRKTLADNRQNHYIK